MVIRRNPEPGRQAVTWLATSFVVLLGTAACAFIVVATVDRPSWDLLNLGALLTGVVIFLACMSISRDRRTGNAWLRLWMAIRGKSDPKTVLRIGRKKSSVESQYGTNAPPTLESIREAAEQNVSWVPHGPPPDRSHPSR